MKLTNLACAMLVVISMASCTAESDATMNYEEVTFSLEKNYNARSVNYVEGSKNDLGLSELPPVSVQEAESILKQLREQKGLTANHSLDSKDGESGQKFLTVSAECCVGNAHKLTLQLSMISYEDDGSLYYKDYKAFASSYLYKWHMNGFGLSTAGTSGILPFRTVCPFQVFLDFLTFYTDFKYIISAKDISQKYDLRAVSRFGENCFSSGNRKGSILCDFQK